MEQGGGHRRRLRSAQGARGRVTATVAFVTLGCRVNQADTHQMQALLEARGLRTVPADC
ncbi:MAG: hypothetical protein EHM88_02760, partial [Candidatus Rokuibacteriota bacterium]